MNKMGRPKEINNAEIHTIYISKELWSKCKQVAKKQHVSTSKVISELIKKLK